jgi:predicted CoA-binding protein
VTGESLREIVAGGTRASLSGALPSHPYGAARSEHRATTAIGTHGRLVHKLTGLVTDFHAHHSRRPPANPAEHCVVVLGASPKPARYSNRAVGMLEAGGYRVVPVHPKVGLIRGLPVVHSLRAIHDLVHTLTLYVGPGRSLPLLDDILRLDPGRVIFNPGTEAPELEQRLHERRIACIHGCTLVMLRTRQF